MTPRKKQRYEKPRTPPWSKLQRAVYLIVAPGLPLQIHCRVYPMDAQYGGAGIPRYWMTLGKEIIWDYPKDFVSQCSLNRLPSDSWIYENDTSEISCLIREYLDTPRNQLLSRTFERDLWSVVGILRAADRRVGSRQWDELEQYVNSEAVTKIIAYRKSQKSVVAKI